VQDSCKTPRKTRRYGMDHGLRRALKTQPLSTRRYPLEPPCSGSSPVVPAIPLQSVTDPLSSDSRLISVSAIGTATGIQPDNCLSMACFAEGEHCGEVRWASANRPVWHQLP
jgi:hypothetical protein